MEPKRLGNGKWLADIQPGGRGGKRIRRQFNTRRECAAFIAHVLNSHNTGQPWQSHTDKRTLLDCCVLWYDLHGQTLKDGAPRLRLLNYMASAMGNPPATSVTPAVWLSYRAKRLSAGISPHTSNRELSYLKAVFSLLIKSGLLPFSHPLEHCTPLKTDQRELSYLDAPQISALLAAVDASPNQALPWVVRLALQTGARWSEANKITRAQVGPDRVTYAATKSGKLRVVPVESSFLSAMLKASTRQDRLFPDCYLALRYALKRSGLVLPKGQSSHILRHTFASYFIQNGGNILALQRVLGHSDITVTMRYAHLAPDHLSEVLRFNPLSSFGGH